MTVVSTGIKILIKIVLYSGKTWRKKVKNVGIYTFLYIMYTLFMLDIYVYLFVYHLHIHEIYRLYMNISIYTFQKLWQQLHALRLPRIIYVCATCMSMHTIEKRISRAKNIYNIHMWKNMSIQHRYVRC